MRYSCVRTIMLAAVVAAATMASAQRVSGMQTGPALILRPWQEPTHMEVDTDMRLFEPARVDDAGEDVRLRRYEFSGRFRLDAEPGDEEVRFGYETIYWDVRSKDDALPERLSDSSVALGWSRELPEHRRAGVVTGIGYAGDRRFGTRSAFYIKGNVIFQQPLDERSMLTFTLNYDENRTIWPDVPLPMVSYSHRFNDVLSYTLGVPISSVHWSPNERLELSASYAPALTFSGRAVFHLDQSWQIFAQYRNEFRAFAVDDDIDRRTFFRQSRLEAGLKYHPHHQWYAMLAGGLAFKQSLERGWDVRSTRTVRDFGSARFLRAAVGLEF